MIDIFNDSKANDDRERVRKAAHKAIPSFRYFKIKHTAELLEEIETFSMKKDKAGNWSSLVKQAVTETEHVIARAEKSKTTIDKQDKIS